MQKVNSCQAGTVQGVSGQYILSSCFNQDPPENYFGNLRSRGGWCDNPSVKSALESAQSLRVQGSLSMMPIREETQALKGVFFVALKLLKTSHSLKDLGKNNDNMNIDQIHVSAYTYTCI